MQIYLARNNQQAGPYTVEQLNQMLASQQVLLTDLIWHEGMSEWKPLGDVTQGQLSYYPAGYQPSTSVNPAPFGQSSSPSYASAHASSSVNLKKTSGQQLAPISKRAFAKIIDLCLWLPATLFPPAFMNAEQHAAMVKFQSQGVFPSPETQAEMLSIFPTEGWIAMGIYILLMLIGQAILIRKTGQSLGKKVMQIQIVDAESKQMVSISRSFFLRSVVFILIYNLTFLPIAALIDWIFANGEKRQTLHDRLAKTIVIEKD